METGDGTFTVSILIPRHLTARRDGAGYPWSSILSARFGSVRFQSNARDYFSRGVVVGLEDCLEIRSALPYGLGAQCHQPFANGRLGQYSADFTVESHEDLRRCTRRRKETDPGHVAEAREAGLGDGGHVRQLGHGR